MQVLNDTESPARHLPVTVVVPVKNEESNISPCLERLPRFAEVIVIDSGSTDRTQQVAVGLGARVVNFDWDGKYPKKRNWLLLNDPPTQPWVLFLDADEFIDDKFCDALDAAITDTKFSGFWLNYTNYFLGKPLNHGLPQRKLALFRVGKALYEKIEEDQWSHLDMEIHEHPIVDGVVGEISVAIDHRDDRGVARFLNKHVEYAQWESQRYIALHKNYSLAKLTKRQRFKYRHIAKSWYPWFYFFYTYIVKMGFMDGGPGFHYAAYKAWYFRTIGLLIREKECDD